MKWRIDLLFIVVIRLQFYAAEDAKIKGSNLPVTRQPMYLMPDTLDFWPHTEAGYLIFKHQESIDLYCESTFKIPMDARNIIRATYSALTERFKVANDYFKLEEITCKANPTFVARKRGSCGNRYELVSIGYEVIGRGFKSIYDICFDYNEMVAKYVQHTLRPGVLEKSNISDKQQTFQDLPSFDRYEFDKFYKKATTELEKNKNIITRGHLAARADFFYGVEQIATYTFPNAAPQWSKFNHGNWEELERMIRSNLHQKTLQCYTGVLGVMPYKNIRSKIDTNELYLDDTERKIPTPIHYFRVVYEPETEKGVVFVGVNDVFQKPLPQDYIVCNQITDKLKGINFNKERIIQLSRGYLYACDFHEFQQKFSYLPPLPIRSLLFEEISVA